MATSPYTAKIGGSLVTVIAGSLNVENQIGQRSTGSMSVQSALGQVWQYGTQVQVFDETNTLVYSGYVDKDKAYKSGAKLGSGYLEHDITLMDNSYRADKRVAFKSYINTSAGGIAQDLVNSYLSAEGVTYTAASIAPGILITEAIWNGKKITDAFTWLAQQSGFWWQIDINGVLWFQPYGGVPAPTILDGTTVEAGIMGGLSVTSGNEQYVNKQYARGAYGTKGTVASPLHEQFHGNSLTRNFTLSYPVSNLVDIQLNLVSQISLALTKGDTGGDWYWAKGDAVIAQDPSQTVLGAGDTLDVYYTGRFPVLAVATNPALVAAQATREGGTSSGIVESVYVNTKVHTLSAAFQIAGALLSHYGAAMTLLDFDTRVKGFAPGQLLTVNLSDFALSFATMLVNSVAISDQTDDYNIWFHVQAVGGPVEAAQWQTYYQTLMQQTYDPSDTTDAVDAALALLLASAITLSPTATVTRTDYTCPIVPFSIPANIC